MEHSGNGRLIGYTPLDISRTLEYAYGDWCVARFASMLGNKAMTRRYLGYSQNYRNIWNKDIKWFCGRTRDGKFGEWRGELVQDH